jgi:hypothetical protein
LTIAGLLSLGTIPLVIHKAGLASDPSVRGPPLRAQVTRHRSDDDRAENYDDLAAAEEKAKAAKKVMKPMDTWQCSINRLNHGLSRNLKVMKPMDM